MHQLQLAPRPRTRSSAPSVNVVILSDIRLFRDGLELSLSERRTAIDVVGVCADAEEALERVRRYPQAIVLVDLGLTRRLTEVRRLKARAPESTLLALALAPDADEGVIAAAEAGIAGYIAPDASIDDLVNVVEHAARGEMMCTPRLAGTLVRRIASLASQPAGPGAASALTAREQEVLELLNGGLSNKQIARRLSIRLATVKNHVHRILAKLNVKRRGEAVAAARGTRLASRPHRAPARQAASLPSEI